MRREKLAKSLAKSLAQSLAQTPAKCRSATQNAHFCAIALTSLEHPRRIGALSG